MRLIVLISAVSAATGLAAQEGNGSLDYFPQQLTASRLLVYCAGSSLTSTGRERAKACGGFISGVEEGVRLLEARRLLKEPSGICVPKGTSASAFAKAFRRHAAGGTRNDQPAAAVVLEMLKKNYPCA